MSTSRASASAPKAAAVSVDATGTLSAARAAKILLPWSLPVTQWTGLPTMSDRMSILADMKRHVTSSATISRQELAEQDAAATAIAAAARGKATRQMLAKEDAPVVEEAVEEMLAMSQDLAAQAAVGEREGDAATAIAAVVKGQLARRELAGQGGAATTIAAHAKGMGERADLREQNDAATAVSAIIKGRAARKSLADKDAAADAAVSAYASGAARAAHPARAALHHHLGHDDGLALFTALDPLRRHAHPHDWPAAARRPRA